MNFFKKILNPFGGNKNRHKYQDLSKDSKKVAPHNPSDLLLYSRDIAGVQIQHNMVILNDCRWIRAEYTYPSFDNMCFMYKNKIFSVIIDIQDEKGKSYLPNEYINRQLYTCETNNLIPCKFPVIVPDIDNPDFEKITAKNKGWNLYHTKNNTEIIPEHMATTEKIIMSEWEMRNFAIRYVIKYLQSQHLTILSYQDTLEVDPQIWFEDINGKKCWLIIRCALSPIQKVEKPKKLKEIIRRCFKNDGYFCGIIFNPINENKDDNNLYRMGNVKIDFDGFEKIHSTL